MKACVLGGALQRSFLELDCRMSTAAGVREMRAVARAEDCRRRENLDTVDLEEEAAAEAADACGLSLAQVRALVASQLRARLETKHAGDSDDEE